MLEEDHFNEASEAPPVEQVSMEEIKEMNNQLVPGVVDDLSQDGSGRPLSNSDDGEDDV